jgi:hypothetical protein
MDTDEFMTGGSGEKTPEQILEEKKAAFAANPNEFVRLEDIVLGAIRAQSGLMVCIGKTNRQQLEIALSRCQFRAFQTFIHMDMQSAEEASKLIVPGNGHKKGILNFARNRR